MFLLIQLPFSFPMCQKMPTVLHDMRRSSLIVQETFNTLVDKQKCVLYNHSYVTIDYSTADFINIHTDLEKQHLRDAIVLSGVFDRCCQQVTYCSRSTLACFKLENVQSQLPQNSIDSWSVMLSFSPSSTRE